MASGDGTDKDDLADALSRMAEGLPAKPQRPPKPTGASEFRAPRPPQAPQPARPVAPDAKSPPAPPPLAKATRPARPDRPDQSTGAPLPPPTQGEAEADAPSEPMSAIVDDDEVIVPAPPPEVFAPHPPSPPVPRTTGPRGIRSLAFRRTVIPILLTCGALLIGIGSLRWTAGADSVFADAPVPVSAGLCGSGAVLLLVAVLNMLQVKSELASSAAGAAPPAQRDGGTRGG